MKWVRFERNGQAAYGRWAGDQIWPSPLSWKEILRGGAAPEGAAVPVQEVRLLNPLGRPGKIVAIGLNYLDHCRETGIDPPQKPLIFTKFSTSVLDPFGEITWSTGLTNQVDFEAELAVVIGRPARRVAAETAMAHVFGYTAANDVSARDLQFGDGQWVRGKSLDTFCPLGPAVVTADEIPDPQRLRIRSRLNGAVMQDSCTDQLIFGVAELIAFASQAFTLEPGDVILTGTPPGVGLGRTPPLYLRDGDVIEVEIEQIGRIANPCRVID